MSSHPLSELEGIALASLKHQQLTCLWLRYGLPSSGMKLALILCLKNAVEGTSNGSSSGSRRSSRRRPTTCRAQSGIQAAASTSAQSHAVTGLLPSTITFPSAAVLSGSTSPLNSTTPTPSTVCPPVPFSLGSLSAWGIFTNPHLPISYSGTTSRPSCYHSSSTTCSS